MQPPGQRNRSDANANKRKSIKPSNTFIPELDALPTTTPITIHFHPKCRSGPYIEGTRLRSMITAPNHKTLAKLCVQEILGASLDTQQLSQRLFTVNLDGEVNIVTAASKNFTVKIPSATNLSDEEMLRFLQTICTTCEACPNLITLEAGSEQCDNCSEQEELANETKNREQSQRKTEEKQTQLKFEKDELTQIQQGLFKKQQKREEEKQTKLPPLKRRCESSDVLSSSSSTSSSPPSSSSSNQNYLKKPKKSIEDSVSVTSETISMQTQTITTTSISSKCTSKCM